MRKQEYKNIIGIDEVGRGPLAGPVAVGVLKLQVKSITLKTKEGWFKGLKDSKKLSPKAREGWLVKINEAKKEGWLEYSVAFVAPRVIDSKGIVFAIRKAMEKGLEKVSPKRTALFKEGDKKGGPFSDIKVLLDGGLHAPVQYLYQETIIKGDEKEFAIALASIVAKVTRDKRMVALGKKFPQYKFEDHKGYGTRAHYAAIKKHGITKHHRKSFLGAHFKNNRLTGEDPK